MPHLQLDAIWKTRIIAVLRSDEPPQEDQGQGERLRRALEELRKQPRWGISDDEYCRDREILMRQLRVHTTTGQPIHLPNLERSANFLEDLPALWLHPRGDPRGAGGPGPAGIPADYHRREKFRRCRTLT